MATVTQLSQFLDLSLEVLDVLHRRLKQFCLAKQVRVSTLVCHVRRLAVSVASIPWYLSFPRLPSSLSALFDPELLSSDPVETFVRQRAVSFESPLHLDLS